MKRILEQSVYCLLCCLILMTISTISFADLTITVQPNTGWGNAPTSNIKKLCENVALHFQENLRDEHKINGRLTIVYRSQGPVTFYRTFFGGDSDEYKIGLKVTGNFWDQMSYQFGHEFCHIMHNHDAMKNSQNYWFNEAICELANVWVLFEMGETWSDRAPYGNWVRYRQNLTNYARNLINSAESQYEGTGAEWLERWEDSMRNKTPDAFTYPRVSQLSYKFLDIFQDNPEAWNAIRQMPASNSEMSEYMKEWYQDVDTEDKEFVEAIADEMGIEVTTTVVAMNTELTIDADVNDDGYVDLYDVLIVRSGMQRDVSYDTDLNDDGKTDEVDLLIVKAIAIEAIVAASPSKRKIKLTTWGAMKRR